MTPRAPLEQLRQWTRFAYRAWRQVRVEPPPGPPPFPDVIRLGLGPLLFRTLSDRQDDRAEPFASSYRLALGTNFLLFARGTQARDDLAARGIEPLLLKGGAFLLRHSPSDLGLRPLSDLDLLVPRERFTECRAALIERGWRHVNPKMVYSNLVAPSVPLVTTSQNRVPTQIDLHRDVAYWPLLSTLPRQFWIRRRAVLGWQTCGPVDEVLMVAVHRARHVFTNDARDLVDLAVGVEELDAVAWQELLAGARALGLTGALYAVLHQAAWWLGEADDAVTRRAEDVRQGLPRASTQQLDSMAAPDLVLTRTSPFATPFGRHCQVFPAALGGYWRSLAAALVFLPARMAEGRSAREVK